MLSVGSVPEVTIARKLSALLECRVFRTVAISAVFDLPELLEHIRDIPPNQGRRNKQLLPYSYLFLVVISPSLPQNCHPPENFHPFRPTKKGFFIGMAIAL